MTPEENRILEHLWDSSRHCRRQLLPVSVLNFLESDGLHHSLHAVRESEVSVAILGLANKGYIAVSKPAGTEQLKLTEQGAVYLTQKHPTLFMYWERLLQLTPLWASFLLAVVGFIASVCGIIQFIDWLKLLPK